MSGHSKWANIKHKKQAQDAKRGQLFTKLSRLITIAAKEGGSPDPQSNYKLRLAVEQAKKANMPSANIKKAIDRVFGGSKTNIEDVVLEAFGPAGTSIIIQAVTDNRQRLIAQIKNVLAKNNGSLGKSGSVAYQFSKVVAIKLGQRLTDEYILALSEFGLVDFRLDNQTTDLFFKPESANQVRQYLDQKRFQVTADSIGFLPVNEIKLEAKEWQKLETLLNQLEANEDVYAVFTTGTKL